MNRRLSRSENLYWSCQILFWSTHFVCYTLEILIGGHLLNIYVWSVLLSTAFAFSLSHLYRQWIARQRWVWLPLSRLVPRAVVGMTVIAVLWLGFESGLMLWVGDITWADFLASGRLANYHRRLLFQNQVMNLLWIGCWSGAYFGYHYLKRYDEERFAKLRLQTLLTNTELRALKFHINPHFLFNCLNSIRSLINEEPGKALEMVTLLSASFRYALQSTTKQTVRFEEELRIVNDYLRIESIRFEERLRVDQSIDQTALTVAIPPMLVQTLVENAIKHGVSKREKGGLIKISAQREAGLLTVDVSNEGALPERFSHEGTGLRSVIDRLTAIYGAGARFEIYQSAPETVTARVRIPTLEIPYESARRG